MNFRYQDRYGIEVGDTKVLLKGEALIGVNAVFDKDSNSVHPHKVWGALNQPFLWQTSVDDLKVCAKYFGAFWTLFS